MAAKKQCKLFNECNYLPVYKFLIKSLNLTLGERVQMTFLKYFLSKTLTNKFFCYSFIMEPIIPTGTDFYCKDNGIKNHTDMYDLVDSETPVPVLRRGCDFYFSIQFDRDYDPYQDVVRVKFEIGNLYFLSKSSFNCDLYNFRA